LDFGQKNAAPICRIGSGSQQTGVDVMITIFCDFSQFSAEKMAFFSKTNVMMKFLQKIAVVSAKNAIFC
jgi:hypothetical protein